MENNMIELNEAQLNTISGGHHHHCSHKNNNGLGGLMKLLNALGKKGGGNLTLNVSIIIVANSYIGGNLIISTTQS